jgi:hypothetical protein
MTTNVLAALENPNGTIFIHVEPIFSEALYAHLQRKKVDCQPPSPLARAAFLDKSGKLVEMVGNVIIAKGTVKDLSGWVDDWEMPLPERF